MARAAKAAARVLLRNAGVRIETAPKKSRRGAK
jgi:hypothetical protein